MATPTDPTFGAGFNAAAFRQAITSTMQMGLPNDESERATFRFLGSKSYEAEDSAGHPFNWLAEPVDQTEDRDVQVPVAVQFEARPATSMDTGIGQFDSPRGTVTVLDVHFQQVKGADLMLFDGNKWTIEYWLPPIGLFDVTIYQAIVTAKDVS